MEFRPKPRLNKRHSVQIVNQVEGTTIILKGNRCILFALSWFAFQFLGNHAHAQSTMREWVAFLEQKMIERHVGGGFYEISPGETGYDDYRSAVDSAQAFSDRSLERYEEYNIELNEVGSVVGGAELGGFGRLMETFYGLGLTLHLSPGTENEEKARNFIKWLQWAGLDEDKINEEENFRGVLGRAAFLTRSVMDAADLAHFRTLIFGSLPVPADNSQGGIEKNLYITENGIGQLDRATGFRQADVLRQHSGSLLPGILMLPHETEEELEIKLEYLDRAKATIIFGATPVSGVRAFLKPDYTGNHHKYHYTSAYVPQAAGALAGMAEFLQGTPWQLSEEELDGIKGYGRELFFYAHYDRVPDGLSGRGRPDIGMVGQCYFLLPLAAMSGESPDEELLQVMANTYQPGFATTYRPAYDLNQRGFPGYVATLAWARKEIEQRNIEPLIISGVRSYPYSPAMAMKRENWTAFAKGMSKWWWSYEGGLTASNPQGIFGIYKSHGALEIRYNDPLNPTGGATRNPMTTQGKDMSHRDGSTTPARTDVDMINDVITSRMRIDSTAVGGVELNKEHGIFMFDLKNTPPEMKDPGLEARKSYFFLGDRIIMLGDNIRSQSPKNYPVHTTLFQNYLDQENRDNSPIFVNSATGVTEDTYTYDQPDLRNSHALVDSYGTGYYVPPGQHLHVERKLSEWRLRFTLDKSGNTEERQQEALAAPITRAYRALAWLDHGINPQGDDYEYVVLPGMDFNGVESFRRQQDLGQVYEVREKSAQAHIVHDLENNLWAYALFADYDSRINGPLKEVNINKVIPHEHERVEANPGYAVLIDSSASNALKLAVSYLDLRMVGDYNPRYTFRNLGPNGIREHYGSAPVELNVVLQGFWRVVGDQPDILKAEIVGNTTVLTVYCIDGRSVNVGLVDEFEDVDQDGMDDRWESQYFGNPTDVLAGYDRDPDGDGQNNLIEYAIGGNPTDGSDGFHFRPIITLSDNSEVNFIFHRRSDYEEQGLEYLVERSENLEADSWRTLEALETRIEPLGYVFEKVINTIQTGSNNRAFVRLRVNFPD